MGQHQKKRGFSLGNKLLLIVVLLIAMLTAFLNISAVLILKEDKQTQTFQSKSTEALLVGSQITSITNHVMDTLRLSLAAADPRTAAPGAGQTALQSVLDNQADALALQTFRLKTDDLSITPVTRAIKRQALATFQDLAISQDWLKTIEGSLRKNNYGFVNLSSEGRPLLGVIVALMGMKDSNGFAPAALGVISLERLSRELSGISLTIATRDGGWVLFDTDPTQFYAKSNISADRFFQFAVASKTANGTHDFEVDGERYLGSFSDPGHDILVLTRAEWRNVMKSTYAVTEKFVLLALMALGAGIVFAILFSKTLSAPLLRLYRATEEVARGNFRLNLKVDSNDEIGSLTEHFNLMSGRIEELFEENAKRIHLENEIEIASAVQQNLIPEPIFKSPDLEIFSHYQSASQCGGDWWGFYRSGDKAVIAIADATGHGLQCAMITAAARSAFSIMQKMSEERKDFDFSPRNMLGILNRAIHDSASGKIMMTCFIGVIDFKLRTMRYANAGHNAPWLFREANGEFGFKSLMAHGQRLGEGSIFPDVEEKSVALKKGDTLFLYTDGLIECLDPKGDMYGKKRIHKAIGPALPEGPSSVMKTLLNDFSSFHSGKGTEDDVTIAIARFLEFDTAT